MKKYIILCIVILSIMTFKMYIATAQENVTTPTPTHSSNAIPVLADGMNLQVVDPLTLVIKPLAHVPTVLVGNEVRDLTAVDKSVYFIQGPNDGSGMLNFGSSAVIQFNAQTNISQVTCQGDTFVKLVTSPHKQRAIIMQRFSNRSVVPNAAKLLDLQNGICEPIISNDPYITLDTPAIDPHWIDDENYVAFSQNIDLYIVNAKMHSMRKVLSTWALSEITPVGQSNQILIKGHLKSQPSTNESPAPTSFSVLNYNSLQTTLLPFLIDLSVTHPLFSQNGQFFVYCLSTGTCTLAEFSTGRVISNLPINLSSIIWLFDNSGLLATQVVGLQTTLVKINVLDGSLQPLETISSGTTLLP